METEKEITPWAYSVGEAAKLVSLGRSTLYDLMKAGTLKYVKVGSRRLIPAEALRALVTEA